MSTSKHIDVICLVGGIMTLLLTLLFVNAKALGLQSADSGIGYETRLFDASKVHSIDIVMDDWDSFIENCESKEYSVCSLVIDGQAFNSVAIRAKGNNSLTSVSAYGNDRYSFKIEFDHYDSGESYYGLDKLNLNNLINDNTMMKDHLVYRMMSGFGVAAPLSSYVYITVNGEDWGLYLAVEGIEEAFLERNYGGDYGALYKPDSTDNAAQPEGLSSSDVKLQYIDDEPSSYSNIFENAKTQISSADKTRLIDSLRGLSSGDAPEDVLDMDSVLRYFVVHNFVCNFDSYTGSIVHNYYLYENNGKLSMLPWDYNLAFGSFQNNFSATKLVNFPIDTPVSDGDISSRPMLAWIFSNDSYTHLYHEYFAGFISQYFDSGSFDELVCDTRELISEYVEQDPTKFCNYEEFEAAVETLKNFCRLRAESISGQLDGSIPATEEEQSTASSSLIDASTLDISDMGVMSAGMPNAADRFEPGNNDFDPTQQSLPDTGFEMPSQPMPPDQPAADVPSPGEQGNDSDVPDADDEQRPDMPQMPFDRQNDLSPDDRSPSADFEQGKLPDNMRSPDNISSGENTPLSPGSIVIPLAVSVLVLIFGLAFALIFKRHA